MHELSLGYIVGQSARMPSLHHQGLLLVICVATLWEVREVSRQYKLLEC